MTLVESIMSLTQLMTQLVQAQTSGGGMTAEQAAQLNQATADVEALKTQTQTLAGVPGAVTNLGDRASGLESAMQTVLATQGQFAGRLGDDERRIRELETDLAALKAGIGDLGQLGGA